MANVALGFIETKQFKLKRVHSRMNDN